MEYTHSDLKYDYFVVEFQGIEMRCQKDKITHGIFINSDDAAKCLGYESLQDMLDKEPKLVNMFLDGINNGWVKNYE